MPSYPIRSAAAPMDARMLDVDRSTVGALLLRVGTFLLRLGSALLSACARRPFDSIGVVASITATGVIVVNALYLQARPHPAPILSIKPRPIVVDTTGTVVVVPPRARATGVEATKAEGSTAARSRMQIISDIQRELARRGFFDGPFDGVYGAKTDSAIRDFEQAAGLRPNSQPDEVLLRLIMRSAVNMPQAPGAASRPAGSQRTNAVAKQAGPSKRILAVQRALADFGYGQVMATGVFGAETKAAIERFERERKLPVTGQISDRLTRELAAVTGRPLE